MDGRAEVAPKCGAPRRLHWVFSHTVCSLFLLCSQTTTQSGEKLSSPVLSGERDHRKLAGGLCLMLGQIGIQPHSPGPPTLPPFLFCDHSHIIDSVDPNLDPHARWPPNTSS